MASCEIDGSLERKSMKGFKFPLGVYPVEALTPKAGYTSVFEAADNEEESTEWEAWPDQYVFDIVLPADRVEALWQQAFAMMPSRVFPIIDYIGHDAFREIDPYMAYEPIGKEKVMDSIRQFRPFFFEDGMVGFGAVTEDPFFYVFVDEHKIVTIRVEISLKPKIESLLASFDLKEIPDPAGADSAAHEHRSVLVSNSSLPQLLIGDEILERMRDRWRLILNVDPESNVDDEGKELGITPWRVLVRFASDQTPNDRYAQIFLTTDCLRSAEDLAQQTVAAEFQDTGSWFDVVVIAADRLSRELMLKFLEETPEAKTIHKNALDKESVIAIRYLSQDPD